MKPNTTTPSQRNTKWDRHYETLKTNQHITPSADASAVSGEIMLRAKQ